MKYEWINYIKVKYKQINNISKNLDEKKSKQLMNTMNVNVKMDE